MSAAPPRAAAGLLVFARPESLEHLAYARRHFEIALEASADPQGWIVKQDANVPARGRPAGPSRRWRHAASDAHLHLATTGASETTHLLELYSRATGRPAPIALLLDAWHLDPDEGPGTILRRATEMLRETHDAAGAPDETASSISAWAHAVAAHLAARGAPPIAAVDLPDAGAALRVVGTGSDHPEIAHPDLAAIGTVVPWARLVEGSVRDVEIRRVRRIIVDGPDPVDAMAVLRATATIAEAVERRNGGAGS